MHLMFEQSECAKHSSGRPAIWSVLQGFVARWWDAQRAGMARRRSLIQLADMEEWQLRDIGLTRADVNHALARDGIGRDLIEPTQPH